MAAAAASWSSDLAGTTTAPQSRANSITIAHMCGSTCSSTLSTQGAPTNRRALPAAHPDRAVPAIGWPPTKLASRPTDLTSSRTHPFTLVTSVNGESGAVSRTCPSTIGSAGTGTANTINAPVLAARFNAFSMFSVASKPSALAALTPSIDRL